MTDLIPRLAAICGAAHVLTGDDTAAYCRDITGHYHWTPRAVVRPGSTAEVAAVVRACAACGTAVVALGGATGLTGATRADGAVMLSTARLNRIRALNPVARTLVAEAGVILQTVHDRVMPMGLNFPLWFGARGSATVGGALATNAGGSNVLRYGNARALCLGVEAVTAAGEVMDLLTPLHKNNAGYDLRDLLIGSEGTLAILTAASLRLYPLPAHRATAVVALTELAPALALLNHLQEVSGGAVEAFELMPESYTTRLARLRPDIALPVAPGTPVTILVELAASDPELGARLEAVLGAGFAAGALRDAVIAQNEGQRRRFWAAREAAADLAFATPLSVDADLAVPLEAVAPLLARLSEGRRRLDPGSDELVVAHLGDGNIHYSAFPSRDDPALLAALQILIEDAAVAAGGTFSAEHGVGLHKRAAMARYKDPVALAMMRAIKAALDPLGILNPGKILP